MPRKMWRAARCPFPEETGEKKRGHYLLARLVMLLQMTRLMLRRGLLAMIRLLIRLMIRLVLRQLLLQAVGCLKQLPHWRLN